MAKKSPAKKVAKKVVKKVVKKIATKANPRKVVKKAARKTTQPLKKTVSKKSAKKVAVKTVKFTAHQTHLKAGDKAPYFEGKDQFGNTVSLNGLAGKTIILYFYPKDDTPGCTATACSLRDEYKILNKSNYAVVGVSADNEKSHSKFAAKYELPFPLLADVDHKIMKAYDVWGKKQFMGRVFDGIIRTTFIIGSDGIIKEVINKVDTANHAQQILNA